MQKILAVIFYLVAYVFANSEPSGSLREACWGGKGAKKVDKAERKKLADIAEYICQMIAGPMVADAERERTPFDPCGKVINSHLGHESYFHDPTSRQPLYAILGDPNEWWRNRGAYSRRLWKEIWRAHQLLRQGDRWSLQGSFGESDMGLYVSPAISIHLYCHQFC